MPLCGAHPQDPVTLQKADRRRRRRSHDRGAPGSKLPWKTDQSVLSSPSAPGARTTRNHARAAQGRKAAPAGGPITPKSGGPISTKSGGSIHTKSCSGRRRRVIEFLRITTGILRTERSVAARPRLGEEALTRINDKAAYRRARSLRQPHRFKGGRAGDVAFAQSPWN
jgi:hypothetical protein